MNVHTDDESDDENNMHEGTVASPDNLMVASRRGHPNLAAGSIGLFAFIVGFPFAQAKRKLPAQVGKFLGVISDFTDLLPLGRVRMYVSRERKEKIASIIEEMLAAATVSGAAAARLAGKLSFVTSWAAWRFGRAVMQPIFFASTRGARCVMSAALRLALTFFLSTLPLLPDHFVQVFVRGRSSTLPRIFVWSDACWSPSNAARPAGLGMVLFSPAHYMDGVYIPAKWYYAEGNCPDAFLRTFCLPRKQRIGELELFAAVCVYLTFPSLLRNRKVTHWIDNTGALAALIKGYARASDLAKIVHAFACVNLGLQCDPWFEYVRSKANIADLPSRGDFALLKQMGAICVPLVLPEASWWDAPLQWYHASRMAAAQHTARGAARSRPIPEGAASGDVRPRRRKYTKRAPGALPSGAHRSPPSVVLAGSSADMALRVPPTAIVDVDISASSTLRNPFRMGLFDSNLSRRREAVALHARWLAAPSSASVRDLRNLDGSPIPAHLMPHTEVWLARRPVDVRADLLALTRRSPDALAFRLCCSVSCSDCICHGSALAEIMRELLRDQDI